MTGMRIEKRGFHMHVSEEFLLLMSGFPKKGQWKEVPLTDEDRELHARAVAAYEEVKSNPWIRLDGYEFDFEVEPLAPKSVFIAEETDEEHMARWIAAGRPDLHRDALQYKILTSFTSGFMDPEAARAAVQSMTGAS